MKILIIVPRYSFSNYANYTYDFPLGIGYISAVLKKAKYDITCLNLNHYNGLTNDLVKIELDKQIYDIVMTGNFEIGYPMVEDVFKAIKEHSSNPKIILGGAIITSEPKIIFEALKVDFGVLGEGEETILELLNCIKNKKDFNNVNGIIYKDKSGNSVITSPRKLIENLNNIPYPDFEGFDFKEKLEHQYSNSDPFTNIFDYPRAYPIITSRGCLFNCSFCYHTQGRQYRERNMENIMNEIRFAVKKYKINFLHIYDDLFSFKKERIYEFCKEIKKLSKEINYDIKWFCQLTVYSAEKELLQTMKDAGCIVISYGFESYHPDVLKSMGKPITPKQIDNALKLTIETGITCHANFIFGDIAETQDTAQTTINYWKENCKGQIFLTFIQPYSGSAINKYCLDNNIIKDQLEFIKNMPNHDIIKMTNKMTDKEFLKLKKTIKKLMNSNLYTVKLLSIKNIGENIYEITTKCPFCKENNTYKNYYLDSKTWYKEMPICRYCGMRAVFISPLFNFVTHLNLLFPLREIYHKLVKKENRFKLFGHHRIA